MVLPPSGSLIAGKYRLESLLGEGGMGAVFRARHEVMDKPVAVKWLKPTCGDEVAARHRFMQEARAAARIRHPNVVDVYDVGEQDGCLFMVMELLEGETFADFLERSGVPVAEAIRHLLAAMRGVAAAHAAGITHRDIKPENVFIAVDPLHIEGVAKILDFGISKLHDEPQPNLTLLGTTMGTPHYMSYEQIRCMADVDHRTDVYAFGVLLYQALTGALPYDADTLPGIVLLAASGRAVRPIALRADLPPELDELVMKAIALSPNDRFQSMDAMINALTRIQLARYAWSASTERASHAPRSPASAVLLSTPPLARTRAKAQRRLGAARALASQPPAAGTTAQPLNPWLGLVGVALGLLLGGSLYTRLMTPTSSASAKASASAPASAPRLQTEESARVDVSTATTHAGSQPVAPADTAATTSLARVPAPVLSGPSVWSDAPGTEPAAAAKLVQRPSAELGSEKPSAPTRRVRPELPSAPTQPADTVPPSPAAHSHRSGPLRLEDL